MSGAWENFVQPMRDFFGDPKDVDDPSGYFQHYVRALERFEAIDLRAAADRMIDKAENRQWPLPKVCIEAVAEARDRRLAPPPRVPNGPKEPEEAKHRRVMNRLRAWQQDRDEARAQGFILHPDERPRG